MCISNYVMLESKQKQGLEFEASLEARVSHMVGNSTTNWKGIISATGGYQVCGF